MRTRRLLAALLAMIMVFSMSPAMLIVSTAADAGVDYQHVTVRTEGVAPYPQQMTAGTVLDVVGGANPIDAGPTNNVRPTDKGVGGSAHGSYGTAWTNGGAGSVAMRSANTWLYGYVIKVEGLTSAAQANVYAQGWGHNGPAGAGTTGGGWNMEYKDAKYNIPCDGVYAILINGQVFGGKTNPDRVAVAFVQKMQMSLNQDATVTFLGEIEAAVEDLTADSFANTLPINYMVDGEFETEEYPITEGLSKGQYITSQNAVAIPALDKKLDAVVDDSTKSTHIGWASTGNAADADVAYAITEKGILDAIYPVYFTVPNVAAPDQQDGWFGEGDKVLLPSGSSPAVTSMWKGNADFGSDGVDGVTIVFKVEGADQPIIGGGATPTITNVGGRTIVGNSNNPNGWAYNDSWGATTVDFDGVTESGGAMRVGTLTNGYHYIYYNWKPLIMDSGASNLITSMLEYKIFDRNSPKSNPNTNATFQMLGVVARNLNPTVNFIANGEVYTYTKQYTNYSGYCPNNQDFPDGKAVIRGDLVSIDEAFASLNMPTPAAPNDGKTYKLVWVDEYKQPVEAIYKSQNVYADFVEVDANQAEVTFVDASDKIISMDYVEKGSTTEFTGATPIKATTATTEYVFVGWADEKDGEVVDLATYTITDDTTFYPVFTEKALPVITMFENPVSTTFGTKKNLLPDGFNATVSGLTGYTLILKVDGIPYGQTAKLAMIRPGFVDSTGKSWDAATTWSGNWVTASYRTNQYEFKQNGYYLYYFPFKNVPQTDALPNEKTVVGTSKLNYFNVFDDYCALGNGGRRDWVTKDQNITITLVGMVEGNIAPFDVTAKKDDTDLATKKTTANVNMLNSTNSATWAKLDTGFDLFGDQIGVEGTQYVESWTNDAGVANEYILTEKVVRPVYANSILLTVAPAGNTAYGIKDYAVDVTLDAETVDSAEIILEYNKNVFTNPHLANGTVLEECPEGAILTLTGVNTAEVLFDIPQNAVGGTYSFNADGTCDSAPAKTTGAKSITVNGQQPGGYFTEGTDRHKLYQTNENNAVVDEEGTEVDEQNVWTGNVDFGGEKDTVTFVFKVDGVQSDINATRIHFNTNNGGQWRTAEWSQWRTNWGRDADLTNGFASALTFKASDGATYYYLTLGRRYINNDGTTFKSMQGFTLFKKDPSTKTTKLSWTSGDYSETQAAFNENENAGFEMLAVVGGNLAPKVEFYNGSDLIEEPYTYEYPKAEGYKDGTGANTAMKKYGTLATVAEVFAASGKEIAATKTGVDENGKNVNYVFSGWVDENGNDVTNAPVYKAQRVYANYEEVAATQVVVTFVDAAGNMILSTSVEKGEHPVFIGSTPTKDADAEYTYNFAGWSLDGEKVVDFDTYVVADPEEGEEGEEGITFKPVYVPDEILKAEVILPEEVAMGKTVEATVKLNRNNLTTGVIVTNGVAENVTEPITSGEIVLSYASTYLIAEGGSNGTVTVPFTSVGADGTINATVTFTAVDDTAVRTTVAVQSGKVSTDSIPVHAVVGLSANIDITGQQVGKYFQNSTPVKINKNDGDTLPAAQTLWSGSVNVMENGEYATGITVVYKLDGVIDPINASNCIIRSDTNNAGKNYSSGGAGSWVYNRSACVLEFNADGYYYLYINVGRNDGHKFEAFRELSIFQLSAHQKPENNNVFSNDRVNTNENATFTMLAVVANNLQPTVVFHGEDGEELKSTTHKYTDVKAGAWTDNTGGALVTLADVCGDYVAPTIEQDDCVLVFNCWVDADGEEVDMTRPLYMNIDLYAEYDKKFTVTYVDGDTVVGTETVMSGEAAALIPDMKTKYEDYDRHNEESILSSHYYVFMGWLDENNAEVDLNNITSNITVYAQYETKQVEKYHCVRWWNDENGGEIHWEWVAEGDTATIVPVFEWSWILNEGKLLKHGTVDENYWYTFSHWDKVAENVTEDVYIYPVYAQTPVATTPIAITGQVTTGKVGEPHVMFNGTLDLSANPPMTIAVIVDIHGASEENPVVLGRIKLDANGGTSNWTGNMPALDATAKETKFTSDGKYIIALGASTMGNDTYNGQWVIGKLTHVGFDDPSASRGFTSSDASGEATYTAYMIAGEFNPEVRFYDENGKWLYTGKHTYETWHSIIKKYSLPSPSDIYKGELPEGFLYWADKNTREKVRVDQVTDNMDLIAVCEAKPGTVKAGTENFVGLKAGTTVEIPVIASGMTFNAITFNVTVSENVTLADVVAAEGFEVAAAEVSGYTATYIAAATDNLVIGKDDSQVIAYVKLTVASDLTIGDAVSIDVDVTQAINAEGKEVKCDGASTTLYATTIYGDVNGDGEVTPIDSTLLMKYVAGWAPSTYAEIYDVKFGDVNGDGEVDGIDSTLLMKYTAGWATSAYADAVNLEQLIPVNTDPAPAE